MNELRYTLLTDGSSDRALIPILTWLLRNVINYAIQPAFADLRGLPYPLKALHARIEKSIELYPCDLLFVHRDAEREPHENRITEIRGAVEHLPRRIVHTVCVVPVRMQEAWLLFDEKAIRWAAGNPHGRQALSLPHMSRIEHLPDPKETLGNLLSAASGMPVHRLKKLSIPATASRVADYIDDFSPLRLLPAFKALEAELESVIQAQGW